MDGGGGGGARGARADGPPEDEGLEEARWRPGTKAFCPTCGVTFTRRTTDARAVAAWWAVHKAGIQHRRRALARTHFGAQGGAVSVFEDEAEVRRRRKGQDGKLLRRRADELAVPIQALLDWTAAQVTRELVVHAGVKLFGAASPAVGRPEVEREYYDLALSAVRETQQRRGPAAAPPPSAPGFVVGRDVAISGRAASIACWAGAVATAAPLATLYPEPRVLWVRATANTSSLARAAPATAALCLLFSALAARTIWPRLARVYVLLQVDDDGSGDGSGEARPVHASPEAGARLVRRLSHHCDALLRTVRLDDFHFENLEYLDPSSARDLLASARAGARAHRRARALLVLAAHARDAGCLFGMLPHALVEVIVRAVLEDCRVSNRCIDAAGMPMTAPRR